MKNKGKLRAITGGRNKLRSFAIWLIAFELAIVFAGSTLLTPLYLPYRHKFGFGELTLTLVYAAYVIGNLLVLFFFGRLSDQIGRKKATWPALAAAFLSTLAFASAAATSWLFVGRALSGFATGLAAGAATAWITELHPRKDKEESAVIAVSGNTLGLAAGPLLGGLLAAYAPLPLRLSFFAYLGLLALAALAVYRIPESVEKPVSEWKQISLKPRLGVPKEIRMQFVSPAVAAFGIMSLVGFYSALVPGLLAQDLHRASPAAGGIVVCAFFFVAAITSLLLRDRLESRNAMLGGLSLLLPSVALLVWAQAARSLTLLVASTVIGGIAMALAYFGSLQVVNRIAPGEQRSEVVSSYMIFCYLGNSVPVIGIGLLSGIVGSMAAHSIFAGVVAGLAIIGLVTGVRYAPKAREETGELLRKAG